MSLDLWIETSKCYECGRCDQSADWNYTYNVAPMWYKVFPDDEGMVQIEGMTGEEAEIKLNKAILYLEDHPEEMKKLNPKNSWGDYDTFLQYLKQLKLKCKEFPKGIWQACR